MKRMGLMLTLAAVLLPLACKVAKKHRLSRKPVVVLDMDVVAERSLPGIPFGDGRRFSSVFNRMPAGLP